MKIWITGIAGFLGGHLTDALRKSNHQIVGNDNFICSSEFDISFRINNELSSIDLDMDCRDYGSMFKALDIFKPDVLIHCAATAHEGLSNFSPSFITRNIYEASVATFSAAIAVGVKRIIFMSSMARYGNGLAKYPCDLDGFEYAGCHEPPFEENNHLSSPIDPYGIAKVASEDTLKALCKLHNVEYVIAVPHSIIGPRQKYDDSYRNVASIMINRALQKKPIYIYGDGLQKRSFSPIEDCLDSLVKMIDAPISGETINIGPDGNEISVLELANMIIDKCEMKTGIKVEIHHLDDRPNEVKNAYCSSDKARKLLGFSPQNNISKCLDEMVEYIYSHGTKPFIYNFPIEIEKGLPKVWANKML